MPAAYSLTDLGLPPGFTDVANLALSNNGQHVAALASPSGQLEYDVVVFDKGTGRWTDLGSTNKYKSFSTIAINDSREVLCYATYESHDPTITYTLVPINTEGQWRQLTAPHGDIFGPPSGLNDSGQVLTTLVVYATGGDGGSALYNNFQPTVLSKPSEGFVPDALGINDKGQILADATTQKVGNYHEYLYTKGQWTDLGSPNGGGYVDSGMINDSGQPFVLTAGGRIYSYSNSQWGPLGGGGPGGHNVSQLVGVDDAGQVLVDTAPFYGPPAFLYSNGQWLDLNTLLPAGNTVTFSSVDAINSNGQILATGTNGQVYLLTPEQPISPPPVPGEPGASGASTPIPFIQAVITLYIDGIEKVLHDSPAVEQSIQENLPWAVFLGFDLGSLIVLEGEIAAFKLQHGQGNNS